MIPLITKKAGQVGYDNQIRESINALSGTTSTGFVWKGFYIPVIGSEYPPTAVYGESYTVNIDWTFATGDLAGETVAKGTTIAYDGAWGVTSSSVSQEQFQEVGLLNNATLPSSGFTKKRDLVYGDTPYTSHLQGEIVNFDGTLYDLPNNTPITIPNAPYDADTSHITTTASATQAVDKGDFVVKQIPEMSSIVSPVTINNTSGGNNTDIVEQHLDITSGSKYVISFNITGYVSGTAYVERRTGANAGIGDVVTIESNGAYAYSFNALGDDEYVNVHSIDGTNLVINDYSFKEVADDKYQCILDAPLGTLLTNTTYFQAVQDITRQDFGGVRRNLLTGVVDTYSFKGIKLFSASEVSLKEPVMDFYFSSKTADGMWSDGTYEYLSAIVFTRFNAKSKHTFFNPLGGATTGDKLGLDQTWSSTYDVMNATPTVAYDKLILPSQVLDMRIDASIASNEDTFKATVSALENGSYNDGIEGMVETFKTTTSLNRIYHYGGGLFQFDDTDVSAHVYEGQRIDIAHTGATAYTYGMNGLVHDISVTGFQVTFETYVSTAINAWDTTGAVKITRESNNLFRNNIPHTELIIIPDDYPSSLLSVIDSGKSLTGATLLHIGQDGTDYTNGQGTWIYRKKLISSTKILESALNDTSTWTVQGWGQDTINNSNIGLNTLDGYSIIASYTAKTSNAVEAQQVTTLPQISDVYASDIHDITHGANVVYSTTGYVSTGTTPTEELGITKKIDGVVSHIATEVALTPDVIRTYSLGTLTNGLGCVVIHYDNMGVLDVSDTAYTVAVPLDKYIKD